MPDPLTPDHVLRAMARVGKLHGNNECHPNPNPEPEPEMTKAVDDPSMIDRVTRAICAEQCAVYGEPPCWQVAPEEFAEHDCGHDSDRQGCRALAAAAVKAMEGK